MQNNSIKETYEKSIKNEINLINSSFSFFNEQKEDYINKYDLESDSDYPLMLEKIINNAYKNFSKFFNKLQEVYDCCFDEKIKIETIEFEETKKRMKKKEKIGLEFKPKTPKIVISEMATFDQKNISYLFDSVSKIKDFLVKVQEIMRFFHFNSFKSWSEKLVDLSNLKIQFEYLFNNKIEICNKVFDQKMYVCGLLLEKENSISNLEKDLVVSINRSIEIINKKLIDLDKIKQENDELEKKTVIIFPNVEQIINSEICVGNFEINLQVPKKIDFINCFEDVSITIEKIKQKESLFLHYIILINLKLLIDKGEYISIIATERDMEKTSFGVEVAKLVMQICNSVPAKLFNLACASMGSGGWCSGLVGSFERAMGKESVFSGIKVNEKANDLFDIILTKIDDRSQKYGFGSKEETKNFFSYNEETTDNRQEMILLLVNNYPTKFNEEMIEKLKTIIKEGPRCGVFTILLENSSYEDVSDYKNIIVEKFKREIRERSRYIFTFSNDKMKQINNKKFNYLKTLNNLNVNTYCDILKKILEKPSQPIYLDTLFDEENYLRNRINPNSGLSIPIGKSGSDIKYLELTNEGSKGSECHTIISGTTGSGKSIFLHTLILSTCYNYSPDEVQFYLMDFKDGVEFAKYKEELKLPHIKFIALQNKIEDALDILHSIEEKMMEVNEIFKENRVTDITNYNKLENVQNGTLPKIPRTFVVIDEYHIIFEDNNRTTDECIKYLTLIAKQGRSAGFHLVLSSQQVPNSIFSPILSQLNTRICFKNTEDAIISLIDGVRNRIQELYLENGRAFFSQGTSLDLIRTAYSEKNGGEHSMQNIIEKIYEKYGDYEINTEIAGNLDVLKVNYDEIPMISNNENYYTFVLGKSFMGNSIAKLSIGKKSKKFPIFIGDVEKTKILHRAILWQLNQTILLNNEEDARVYYLNYKDPTLSPQDDAVMKYEIDYSDYVEFVSQENCNSKLDEINSILKERKNSNDNNFSPIFVFVSSSEKFYESQKNNTQESYFSFSSNPSSGNNDALFELFSEGYPYSIFVIPHFKTSKQAKQLLRINDIESCICFDSEEIGTIISNFNNVINLDKNCAMFIDGNIISKVKFLQIKE